MRTGYFEKGQEFYDAVMTSVTKRIEGMQKDSTDCINAKEFRAKFENALRPFCECSFDIKDEEAERLRITVNELKATLEELKAASERRKDPNERALS